ncbi:MAG: hypothetical protein ACOCP4_05510 [Candidatus Woesearchaeota archaeon]
MTEEDRREDRESIKLIKNSKGYNWEIKILNPTGEALTSSDIDRIKKLDEECKQKWGEHGRE